MRAGCKVTLEDHSPLTEAEALERSRAGDARAFDRLVQEHYVLVYNTAYRLLGKADRAEDATLEAFTRAFRSLDRFRGESAFSTWLYRIVTNVCLDYARSGGPVVQSLDEGRGEQGELHREIPDDRLNPAQVAEQRQVQRLVHAALQELSAEHRAVLVLYDLNGFSYEEVGRVLGIPVGTVKSRLNRARHALKEQLAANGELF